jgi:hypothetical protein
VVLTVDHVTPVALGGTDDPNNLVAACKDCNSGKASTTPGADLVADVKKLDMQWAGAMRRLAAARGRQQNKSDAYVAEFDAAWLKWTVAGSAIERPAGWRTSVERFYDLGVPIAEVTQCVRVACGNDRIYPDDTFRYFAGCVWRVVKDMQDAAKELLDAEAVEPSGT